MSASLSVRKPWSPRCQLGIIGRLAARWIVASRDPRTRCSWARCTRTPTPNRHWIHFRVLPFARSISCDAESFLVERDHPSRVLGFVVSGRRNIELGDPGQAWVRHWWVSARDESSDSDILARSEALLRYHNYNKYIYIYIDRKRQWERIYERS